ncbi:MAG: hypothetical protein PF495_01475, partial [Spirochaetales bacterium]|nr:hypothetical protein [Spirochaetales bacterium]
ALGIAAGMNEFARQSDMIYMANYAQTVNVIGCIKANTTHSVMASTGQVLKLYRAQFGSVPVSMSGDTRPLDIAAALNVSSDTLVVSAVNPTWDRQELKLSVKNSCIDGEAEKWMITGPDDMAYNEPGKEERVIITGPETVADVSKVMVEPYSVNIFRIPLKTMDK